MSEPLPNIVEYICGPMAGCKSKVTMSTCDYNYPGFMEVESARTDIYQRQGYLVLVPDMDVGGAGEAFQNKFQNALEESRNGGPPVAVLLNPARIQIARSMFGPDEERTYWRMSMLVDAGTLMKACQQTLGKGKLNYVLTPPAHAVESTAEAPLLKTWGDSSGAHIEVFLGFKMLDASFIQSAKNQDGSYRFAPVPVATIERDFIHSRGMKSILEHYQPPALPQPAPAPSRAPLPRDLSAIATAGERSSAGQKPLLVQESLLQTAEAGK